VRLEPGVDRSGVEANQTNFFSEHERLGVPRSWAEPCGNTSDRGEEL
jgi:hypothetical protein